MAYTTDKLLASIERQSFAPSNQSTFSTLDILSLADEVSKTTILPTILSVGEEYYLCHKDYPIQAGVSAYAIPDRAIGLIVREISIVRDSGEICNISRSQVDNLYRYGHTETSLPQVFYVKGNEIVLYPSPSSTINTLRMYYLLRPGDLVETTAAGLISSIDTTTNVINVSVIPSTWVTGNTFDLIQGNGGHRHMAIDLTSTLISGTAITLPSLPVGLAVGDYIALAGESPVVQMPPDFQPVLSTLTAAEMLLAMSQPKGEKMLSKGMKILENTHKMLTPRVIGELEVILPDWS